MTLTFKASEPGCPLLKLFDITALAAQGYYGQKAIKVVSGELMFVVTFSCGTDTEELILGLRDYDKVECEKIILPGN